MTIFTKNKSSRVYFETLQPVERDTIQQNQLSFLQRVADYTGTIIFDLIEHASSLYRDPEYNAQVNGSPTSRHLQGIAGDWPLSFFEKAHEQFEGGTRLKLNSRGELAWYRFFSNGTPMIHIEWRRRQTDKKKETV